jgi:hypothetical protein
MDPPQRSAKGLVNAIYKWDLSIKYTKGSIKGIYPTTEPTKVTHQCDP